MNLVERFIDYVKIDTQSDPTSTSVPSTPKQWDLLKKLQNELEELGCEVYTSAYGVLYGVLKGNPLKEKVGLIAHVDTSFDASGTNVVPRLIEHYDGGIIPLGNERFLDPTVFESLKKHQGHDLIVTDGSTLLGADDKAGIAIIMEVVTHYATHPSDIGDLYVAFTPDEEIGAGTDHFELERFPVAFAYTLDGSSVDVIDFENFNAASAQITIEGSSIHPGSAKGKMINALLVGMELEGMLPMFDKPQHTEGLEGFIHLVHMSGNVEEAKMEYILRHHDKVAFEHYKTTFQNVVAYLNGKYHDQITCIISDHYENMRNYLEKDMRSVNLAKAALHANGIIAKEGAIRGGTDGARLSAMGLLTPNLGTGGYNFHGPYEYLSIQEMRQSVEVVKYIVEHVDQ